MIKRIILALIILTSLNSNTHATILTRIEINAQLAAFKQAYQDHNVKLPSDFDQLEQYTECPLEKQHALVDYAYDAVNDKVGKLLENYFTEKNSPLTEAEKEIKDTKSELDNYLKAVKNYRIRHGMDISGVFNSFLNYQHAHDEVALLDAMHRYDQKLAELYHHYLVANYDYESILVEIYEKNDTNDTTSSDLEYENPRRKYTVLVYQPTARI